MTEITSMHADRAEHLPRWTRNRDHIKGADAVKAKGDLYLPKKEGQTDDDHKNLIKFTEYYAAASRTFNAIAGLVFRKAATFDRPDDFERTANVLTFEGWSIDRLAKWIFKEYQATNDGAALIEAPTTPEGVSLKQFEALGLDPFVTRYPAESILEIRYSVVNSRRTLSYIRLLDTADKVRELELNNGVYTVRVHERIEKDWVVINLTPTMRGKPLTFIPIVLFSDENDDGARADTLCELNNTHYIKSSLIGSAERWISSPVIFTAGVDPDAQFNYDFGSRWNEENADASAQFLNHDGSGIVVIERDLERIADHMAAVGARMLQTDRGGTEAAETVARRQTSENSLVAMDAHHTSERTTAIARIVAMWKGLNPEEVKYTLNTDFAPTMVTEGMIRMVSDLNDMGKLPDEAMFEFLKAGEVINDSWTYELYQTWRDTRAID